jgi:hypothetical protein
MSSNWDTDWDLSIESRKGQRIFYLIATAALENW